MAKGSVTEEEQALSLMQQGQSFVLSGGAGSGKTYSLIEIIKGVYVSDPLANIACITYTNVAVTEIKARAPFENLYVSTIHEFLWHILSPYQTDLKKSLVRLIASESISTSDKTGLDEKHYESIDRIEYREWVNIEKGTVSHDELVKLAVDMFEHNKPLLATVVADRFDYIFVDEYQDTFSEVIAILLDYVHVTKRPNVIGFFGDSMQAIYDRSSPEDVKLHVGKGSIAEIVKLDNRRNPSKVLDVIRNIRDDRLTQRQSTDVKAPNYQKNGSATFLYSQEDAYTIADIKSNSIFKDWNFNDSDKTKELYLVKKFIAIEAGFQGLMDIYVDDGVVKYKDAVRSEIKRQNILIDEEKTFGEIIEQVNKSPSPAIRQYLEQNPSLLAKAKEYKYSVFRRLRLDADLFMGSKKVSEYDERDRGQRCDDLMSHLMGLQELIDLYESKQYNLFIRKTHYKVVSANDMRALKEHIANLLSARNDSIEAVLQYAHDSKIWPIDDKLKYFKEAYPYRWDRVMSVPYSEIINLHKYTENKTPYSTQHGVKGAEYDDVLVVLDNGGWSSYNFKYLFESGGTESVRARTRKMFYVCCSRAKNNLVVFFHQPSDAVLTQAKSWFGEENVIRIS